MKKLTTKYVYSPQYDIALPGIDRLHPFDGRKYSKAANRLKSNLGAQFAERLVTPSNPVADETLKLIHTEDYLSSLKSSSTVAQVMEVKLAGLLPSGLLQKNILAPIKLATQGTVDATEIALKGHTAMNIGGGFHHAFATHGEGFCFFADAAIAIEHTRRTGALDKNAHVAMIDLDAHRGNGFEAIYQNDEHIHIFDMYNFQVYPGLHEGFPDTRPFSIPVKAGTNGKKYLDTLQSGLPKFFEKAPQPDLVFYNAGTDILDSDSLGALSVDYESVVERDKFVLKTLAELNVPTVIMTSGGYSKHSFALVAELATLLG